MSRRVVSFIIRIERLSATRCSMDNDILQVVDNNLGGNAESFRPMLVLGAMGFFYFPMNIGKAKTMNILPLGGT